MRALGTVPHDITQHGERDVAQARHHGITESIHYRERLGTFFTVPKGCSKYRDCGRKCVA